MKEEVRPKGRVLNRLAFDGKGIFVLVSHLSRRYVHVCMTPVKTPAKLRGRTNRRLIKSFTAKWERTEYDRGLRGCAHARIRGYADSHSTVVVEVKLERCTVYAGLCNLTYRAGRPITLPVVRPTVITSEADNTSSIELKY